MTNTSVRKNYLDRQRACIRSSKGGWVVGKGVMNQGYEMMTDFVGHLSYMQVVVFNATGKMVDRPLADWIEATHICLSWPDPRIWCNHIGALAGTMKASVVAGTVAGNLAADSHAYGQRTLYDGVKFIRRVLEDHKRGLSVKDIVQQECAKNGGKPFMMGFARPIAKGDERVSAMLKCGKDLGFEQDEHLSLALSIHDYLLKHFDESININGYMSSFLSDQGFTATEVYRLYSTLVVSGVTACYVDTVDKPKESFFAMQCNDIDYQGPPLRPVPEY